MTTTEIRKPSLDQLYEEIADFIVSRPSVEQISAFHLSDASDHYISELLEANRTRGLTPDERAALEDFRRVEHLMQVVKIRAYAKLDEAKQGHG